RRRPARRDEDIEKALRPRVLDDFIGQQKIKDNLRVFLAAALQRGETLDYLLHKARRLDDARRPRAARPGLEGDVAFGLLVLDVLDLILDRVAADVGVDLDAVAQRTAQQLVDGHAQRLAGQIPECLVDARDRAGQDWAAAVKRVFVVCLPVVDDAGRVLADEIVGHFVDGRGHRACAALHHGFAQADQPFVGVDF
ncbi:MAG: hypothetical protein HC802_19840, partial [Caldilineaceae bacterium]|nr:hypothetical protein [Caldilineaceae bacterium]